MGDHLDTTIDRRSVLGRLGAGFAAIGVGSAGATASGRDPPPEHLIEPGSTFEADTGGQPGVREAELTVREASVSTHVRLDVEDLASAAAEEAAEEKADRVESPERPTMTTVRLGFGPDELPRPRPGNGNGNGNGPRVRARGDRNPGDGELKPAVARSQRTVGGLTTQGHLGGTVGTPSTGSRDVVAFGHTKSQECGPLARTAVRADSASGGYLYNRAVDRESVDGDACRGHEWNGTFEAFCDYLGWIPGYDCGVPSVFDTSWHAEGTAAGSFSAQTVYACYDFPAVPDTVVVAQDVELEGGSSPSVSYDAAIGVSDEDDISDYGWDSNGIANLVVDGIDAVLGTGRWSQAFTLAVSAYLLEQDQGVVS